VEPEEYRWTESGATAYTVARPGSGTRVTVRHLIDTFGSTAMAIEWLNDFCPDLSVRPAELMDDDRGRLAINRVLVRSALCNSTAGHNAHGNGNFRCRLASFARLGFRKQTIHSYPGAFGGYSARA
jgi:hypothetical protein